MGCNGSKNDSNPANTTSVHPTSSRNASGSSSRQHSHRIAKLNDDEEDNNQPKPKMKFASSSTSKNMNKYMLKFNTVRKAYATIEAPFRAMWAERVVRPHLQLEAVFSTDVESHTKGQLELDELRVIITKPHLRRTVAVEDVTRLCHDLGLDDCITEANIQDTFKPKDGMVTFQQALVGVGNAVLNNKTLTERYSRVESRRLTEDGEVINEVAEEGPDKHRQALYKGFKICRDMFNDIDDDGSGEIDYEEFREAFFHHGDAETTSARMKEMDFDDNKAIDFNEFLVGIGVWAEDCAQLDEDDLERMGRRSVEQQAMVGNEV